MIQRKEVLEELSRRKFRHYVEYVHNGRYLHGAFTRYLADTVQEFIEKETGNAYDILCLSVPPQHSKSTTITETLPSWILGKNPDARIILVSYNTDFAKLFLRRNRDKIEEKGLGVFGLELGTVDNAEEVNIKGHQGSIISRGILSGITGRPAEYIIIDDPIKNREEADSDTIRDKNYQEWLSSIKTRLAPNAKVIVIQTRWHKQDLIGMLVDTEPNVTYINFPIVAEGDDILGRKAGDTLFPEIKKDRAWWDDFKKSYLTQEGSRALNALYYGRPSNVEGGIFMRRWFLDNLYEDLPKVAYKVIEVDATFKDTKKSDYVAIQVWGKVGKDCYLIEKTKQRMGFVETLNKIEDVVRRHSDYNEIGIEDKANGSAIIDVLRRRYRAVIPIEPYGSKESRASAISPMVEAGDVHIKSEHFSLIDEAIDFPNSDHDDEVDAMSQALNRLRNVVAIIKKPKDEDDWDFDDQINDVLSFK